MNESYVKTRDRLETYFDKTAAKTWEVLTSDLPVSGIRARVRSGRDQMRDVLLSSLPSNLTGTRVLDAGCGTGQISFELAKRGAQVLGVDISTNLINVANDRMIPSLSQKIEFKTGDMLSDEHGKFDYVVAMDSLIHYGPEDITVALEQLAKNTSNSILFTVAPRTVLLSSLLAIGKLLPRSDRSPQIEPVNHRTLNIYIKKKAIFKETEAQVLKRIKASFYVSEALVIKL
ncbi:MAG: magnesium protoporphyrin IX methyltransferase [Paracoccaceae bacterium]|nr:magnesium protoporphyrin IX methyltransferase [Paracoccaceae bacterium]